MIVLLVFLAVNAVDGSKWSGGVVDIKDYPSTILVEGVLYGGNFVSFCTGSILSEIWALSSANCFDEVNDKEVVLSVGKSSYDDETSEHKAKSIIRHPNYKKLYLRGQIYPNSDIALTKVEPAFPINGVTVVAATLARQPMGLHDVSDVSSVVVVGWGTKTKGDDFSTELRATTIKAADTAECKKTFILFSDKESLCIHENRPFCYDEAKGPLFGDGVLIAIPSWSQNCDINNHFGMFTRVSHYIRWITEETGLPLTSERTPTSKVN